MATELAQAYVQIIPSAKGIKGKISEALGSEAQSAGASAGGSIASGIASTLKTALVGLGVGKIVKDALFAGGELQQSFGGLDTLYGDAANAAKEYATQATQAGISANNYAEQAVSFGAALKQAYGGDTYKAMEAANTAILDMADNSAKMGTDIGSIQNAYQGFAKQNYTMLDNLKLGYGGTKSEMERLLADAKEFSGVDYNIDNLGDVYSAIHVIQENLGLTGVAANEAKETFTGSFAAMQSAVQNLLANLALGENIGPSLDVLRESVMTFLQGNLLPMIGNLLSAAPEVLDGLSGMITEILKMLADSAPEWVTSGLDLIGDLAEGLISAAPQMLSAALALCVALIDAMMDYDWIGAANNLISSFSSDLTSSSSSILGTDGGGIITGLVNGILAGIPNIITAAGMILTNFVESLLQPEVIDAGIDMIMDLVDGIITNLPAIIEATAKVIATLQATVIKHSPELIEKGILLIGKLIAGIYKALPSLLKAMLDLVTAGAKEIFKMDWWQTGKDIIAGIVRGIRNAGGEIWEAIKGYCQKALDGIKDFFKIGSPSKLLRDEVGKMIPAGMAIGIEDGSDSVTKAMNDMAIDTLKMAQITPAPIAGGASGIQITNTFTIEAGERDPEELAREISYYLDAEIKRQEEAYA